LGNFEDTNWRHHSVDTAVINLPLWPTLTPEHEAPGATMRHHQEVVISGLTSTNGSAISEPEAREGDLERLFARTATKNSRDLRLGPVAAGFVELGQPDPGGAGERRVGAALESLLRVADHARDPLHDGDPAHIDERELGAVEDEVAPGPRGVVEDSREPVVGCSSRPRRSGTRLAGYRDRSTPQTGSTGFPMLMPSWVISNSWVCGKWLLARVFRTVNARERVVSLRRY
jgi:hypothetical protein